MRDAARVPGANRVAGWLGRWGLPLCAAWGFAEATLFFIVPDVAVSAAALYRPRLWLRAAALAVAGALAGGALLFGVAHAAGPHEMRRAIERVPGIPARMIEEARGRIEDDGGVGVVLGPLAGIPYKIFVTEWALDGRPLWSLLLWTVPARAGRFLGAGLVAAAVGAVLRRAAPGRDGAWIFLHLAAWTAVYVAYFRANGF